MHLPLFQVHEALLHLFFFGRDRRGDRIGGDWRGRGRGRGCGGRPCGGSNARIEILVTSLTGTGVAPWKTNSAAPAGLDAVAERIVITFGVARAGIVGGLGVRVEEVEDGPGLVRFVAVVPPTEDAPHHLRARGRGRSHLARRPALSVVVVASRRKPELEGPPVHYAVGGRVDPPVVL